MRVLLVDDSRTMRKMIRRTLEAMGHASAEILEAADGAEALTLLRNERLEIDLVLLDWNMPNLDGPGFLKALRPLSEFRETSVIMVTSQSQHQHVAEAVRLGACDYIVKPFSDAVLREKLGKISARIEQRKCSETNAMLGQIASVAELDGDPTFLQGLPEDVIREMFSVGRLLTFPAGATVLKEGAPLDGLYVLFQGEAEAEGDDGAVLSRGDILCERDFLLNAPARSRVSARCPVELLYLSRAQVGDLVRRCPRLGFALSSLAARRSTARRRKPETDSGLSGNLHALPIPDLVQILNICKKTGHLKLFKGGEEAGIFYEGGEVRHAWTARDIGEPAFYRLMGWTDAQFVFDSGVPAPRVTVSLPTMSLLMEGMRQLDDARRGQHAP